MQDATDNAGVPSHDGGTQDEPDVFGLLQKYLPQVVRFVVAHPEAVAAAALAVVAHKRVPAVRSWWDALTGKGGR